MVFPVIVLDSSFIVSLFLPEDDNHAKAEQLMSEKKEEDMFLSDLVLFETLTVLSYKKGGAFAQDVYEDLSANRKIHLFNLNEQEKGDILHIFFSLAKMSIEDASVIYLAKKTNSEALCFDRQIIQHLKM